MKGYIITVKTSKYVNGHLVITKSTVDNKVWRNLCDAQQRVRQITFRKCEKHNYRRMYDCLSSNRKDRLHSEMDYAIERNNFNVVKHYTIRPMQIG